MSLAIIRSVLGALTTTQAWTAALVKIKNSKRNGTTYAARGITLAPEGALSRVIANLSKVYTEGNNAYLGKYASVNDYDGSADSLKVYRLQSTSELIADEYTRLIQALSVPEMTGDPLDFAANAYALKAALDVNGEEKNVVLFSLQNPICVLKNRFIYENSTFFEINKKVLNLRQNIDVVIIDNMIYLLTLTGEKLFNMERSYRAICVVKTEDICDSGIISNVESFRSIATSGHNPRRFVAFNQQRYDAMKDAALRRRMAAIFQLTLDDSGLIDTSSSDASEKLIKVLCNKGMVDPFGNVPVEVSAVSRW